MDKLTEIALFLLSIAQFFILAHFIISWLVSFQVLNTRNEFVGRVWYALNRLLEPVYGPIRRILPPMGGIDLSPLVALIGIQVLTILLR